MSEQVSGYRSSAREVSGWAVGGAIFAATMMMMAGIFQALNGLVAIFKDQFYLATRNYLYKVDVTTWGWVHLVLGVVVLLAGFSVLSGRLWARLVGITLAVLSAIANFMFIPYYPLWSLLIIALDVLAIWGLATYTRQAAA
jgi:hypothetical protein